jgi:hypothetical protein
MLLVAVGYGKNGEFEGTGWKSNVLKLAQNKGITIDGVDLAKNVTREEAAQYVFNAMTQVNTVTYVKALDKYVYNNNTTVSGSTGSATTEADTLGLEYYGLKTVSGIAQAADQSASKIWSDTCYLVKGTTPVATNKVDTTYPVTTSVFDAGRQGYIWVAGDAETQLTDIYYTDGGTKVDTYAGYAYGTDSAKKPAFVNGEYSAKVVLGEANGRHTKVYNNISSYITVIAPTVAKVTSIDTFTATSSQNGLTKDRTYVSIGGVTSDYVDADSIDYAGIAVGNVVTYVKMPNGKYYVAKCASYTGAFTAFTLKQADVANSDILNITVGGSVYYGTGLRVKDTTVSSLTTMDTAKLFNKDDHAALSATTQYVVYVDNGGYVVATDVAPVATAAKSVAVIDSADAAISSVTTVSPYAGLVYADGDGSVTANVAMDKYYGSASKFTDLDSSIKSDKDLTNHLVSLEETAVGSGKWKATEVTSAGTGTTVKTFNSTTISPVTGMKLNANTRFILKNSDKTYTTFTGLSNVPTIYAEENAIEYINDGDVTTYVYINAYKSAETTTKDFFVLKVDTSTVHLATLSDGKTYTLYDLITYNYVDGVQTYYVDSTLFTGAGDAFDMNKYYSGVVLHGNVILNNATGITSSGTETDPTQKNQVSDILAGSFKANEKTYFYNDNTVFIKVDAGNDGGVTKAATSADLSTSSKVIVSGTLNSDGTTYTANVVYIYFSAKTPTEVAGAGVTYLTKAE